MSDIFENVTGSQNFLKKILGKIPGFKGYIERENRRASDKLLRGVISERYEEQWGRISSLQRDLINQGGIEFVDDLEAAAIKLRQFIDRVRTATYGYSPFFDALTVNEEVLSGLYQHDLNLLNMADEVRNAVDNVETSIGTDGLPASIRALISLSERCVEAFNRRAEIVLGGSEEASQ